MGLLSRETAYRMGINPVSCEIGRCIAKDRLWGGLVCDVWLWCPERRRGIWGRGFGWYLLNRLDEPDRE